MSDGGSNTGDELIEAMGKLNTILGRASTEEVVALSREIAGETGSDYDSGSESGSGSDGGSRSSYTGSSYTGSSRSGSRSRSGSGSESGSSYSGSGSESDGETGPRGSSRERSRGRGRGGAGGEGTSPSSRSTMTAQRSVASGAHPRPIDLWRATHEVAAATKPTKKLKQHEWKDLVHRLNDSSRTKHMYLMRAQHKQIADELRGLRFAPQICQRSRDIASRVPTLPERIDDLMKLKKVRQDKLRHELAQEEFHDITFQPKINSRSRAMVRGVNNLTRYGEVQRVRRQQRARIMQEVEDRELTFSPQINRRSYSILQAASKPRPSLISRTIAAAAKAKSEAASVGSRRSGRSSRSGVRSTVPGHEEENFSPRINARSRKLARDPSAGNVFSRLYSKGKQRRAARNKGEMDIEARMTPTLAAEKRARRELARSPPAGVASAARPGSASFFNVVVYDAGKHGFIGRHLIRAEEASDGHMFV